ncbi:anthranilate synthase component 1 [Endobacter medicaginis]|uniref:Anthranilate synthase component 1 n=2 Tax=Endobacter medicaginis TaxID=1181271 RepID=A0A839USH8_9PROT|nr:anthranilate synthase component 1 [Endobacter medicaginis]MCX5474344.1 anthranilate synthase component I [Endobacter medicaginis]
MSAPLHAEAGAAAQRAAFIDTIEAGHPAVLWTTLPADLITPVAAFLKLTAPGGAGRLAEASSRACLLESVEGGSARGRYSVIALLPDLVWQCRDGAAMIDRDPSGRTGFMPEVTSPLDSLAALIEASQFPLPAGLPPIAAGLVGYLGYDMVRQFEHLPAAPPNDLGVPEGVLMRPSLFVIFDNVRDELTFTAPVYPVLGGVGAQALHDAARSLIETARAALEAPLPRPVPQPVARGVSGEPSSTFTREGFIAAVLRAKSYIAAGDAFQIVPSQRFTAPFELSPLAFYRALRRVNPAPFLFLFLLDGFALAGSSPEVLVRLRDGEVMVRPLAGTRPRGATPEADAALEAELLADPKERAEHLMLVDLGRNDVGRVTTTGSVRVAESFTVERYSHVMHLSSTVVGRVRPDVDALTALAAGFPAGTLTGAPKIRAMEIIDELEPTRRATYAGCVGYFSADGSMDTCIGLRMALLKDGMMHVQAGAGVVADSDPAAEYEETRQKARALFRAADEARRLAAAEISPG